MVVTERKTHTEKGSHRKEKKNNKNEELIVIVRAYVLVATTFYAIIMIEYPNSKRELFMTFRLYNKPIEKFFFFFFLLFSIRFCSDENRCETICQHTTQEVENYYQLNWCIHHSHR